MSNPTIFEATTPDEPLPEKYIRIGDKVAYSWDSDEHLTVWHWCDHHLWAGRAGYDADPTRYWYWTPAGVGGHTLVSREPLHLEPSLYWPDCCGMHGFIRDGKWISV